MNHVFSFTFDTRAGCWIGPRARMQAQSTMEWIARTRRIDPAKIVMEKTGGGTTTEWRVKFINLGYFAPTTKNADDWNREADYWKAAMTARTT